MLVLYKSCYFDRDAVNYAKWQLLRGKYFQYSSAIQSLNPDTFYKIDYPVPPELGASNDFACVGVVEKSMPLAVARPFVEEFITRDLINLVSD